jgi:hypothetical protein
MKKSKHTVKYTAYTMDGMQFDTEATGFCIPELFDTAQALAGEQIMDVTTAPIASEDVEVVDVTPLPVISKGGTVFQGDSEQFEQWLELAKEAHYASA